MGRDPDAIGPIFAIVKPLEPKKKDNCVVWGCVCVQGPAFGTLPHRGRLAIGAESRTKRSMQANWLTYTLQDTGYSVAG